MHTNHKEHTNFNFDCFSQILLFSGGGFSITYGEHISKRRRGFLLVGVGAVAGAEGALRVVGAEGAAAVVALRVPHAAATGGG